MDEDAPDIEAARILFEECGALPETPAQDAYEYTGSTLFQVTVVPIRDIQCFRRGPGVPGIVKDRGLSVLYALRDRIPLPPVNVYPIDDESSKFRYLLYHGYHRFHLSLAAGYTHIPVAINNLE
jgi:hypothetical protein